MVTFGNPHGEEREDLEIGSDVQGASMAGHAATDAQTYGRKRLMVSLNEALRSGRGIAANGWKAERTPDRDRFLIDERGDRLDLWRQTALWQPCSDHWATRPSTTRCGRR